MKTDRFLVLMTTTALAVLVTAHRAASAADCESTLVIPPGIHRLTEDAVYDCVVILPGGVLHTTGHTLTVTCPGGLTCLFGGWLDVNGGTVELTGGGTHSIDGFVTLTAADAAVRVSCVDAAIDGFGVLAGGSDSAEILIDADVTLTNEMLISGGLRIKGDIAGAGETSNGAFANEGFVMASGGLTLALHADTPLLDFEDAAWGALDDGSVLLFDRAHTGEEALRGIFFLAPSYSSGGPCPRIRFGADITTSGKFGPAMRKGCIDVNDATFTHAAGAIAADTGYCDCSCP